MEKEESVVVAIPVAAVMVEGVPLSVWPGEVDFERAGAVARCINWEMGIC